MTEPETFMSLVRSPGHWAFELFLMAVVDGLIGCLLWPHIKRFGRHHKSDDDRLAEIDERLAEVESRVFGER